MPALRKVVIFGVGLIGGSFALALRKAGAVGEVVGFGRSATTLESAKRLGILDRIGSHAAAEVGDADLVLLATPVAQMADVFARIAPHLGAQTLITDGGSTKGDVVAAARANLGDKLTRFVPAHPIAGAELSGPQAAVAELYAGKKVVLTPLPENAPEAVARVRQAWELCGAQVSELTPQQHDEVFAAVSHLPHLLSFALVHDIAQRDNREQLLSFAASGFRDFTRIAASSPEMWRDICMANREVLFDELGLYIQELESLHAALADADAEKLEEVFSEARKVRSAWTQQ
ncbi:MAG: prephenate dehydrogenase/arogenate dehydrogenase family protein [Gallionella sp.]|nr:prephenate dehydrogenase/arogenate dehydrogenase family protein [Gallionella sp.]NCP80137.1 prephenate dehydrogenase/arogenate dehydrogenase family protein [Gallionella sp.]NCS75505.1 prephenate dehydrogenase/arogenate dehydrogenase family protein [Gallionella sp.]PIR09503.1 MAG: prephenate dehydrogenase [Gallionellaceae bacterium CG11_big_fil_rev_8_21_14_0_20_60_62]